MLNEDKVKSKARDELRAGRVALIIARVVTDCDLTRSCHTISKSVTI